MADPFRMPPNYAGAGQVSSLLPSSSLRGPLASLRGVFLRFDLAWPVAASHASAGGAPGNADVLVGPFLMERGFGADIGEILPPVEAVAKALADRDHVKLQPFGGYAANLLRLSEQVPARVVFLTDGKSRKVHYGNRTIELRQASPRMMAAAGRMTGLVIAGLRYVGKANITSERVAHLRKLLSPEDRLRLLEDITLAPAWMHPYFRSIARDEGTT